MDSGIENKDNRDGSHNHKGDEKAITDGLAHYQERREQRYNAVNVLLLTWRDDDIGVAPEVDRLGKMFGDIFNYKTWSYKIPSENSGARLSSFIAQAVHSYGREDCLLIIYYGGHGDQVVETKSPCTWAAKKKDGPDLNWEHIQPQLFLASCDVIIILDCCFAGQAVRARSSQRVEFLAATDKDQYTATGLKGVPSFTTVFMEQAEEMMKANGVVSISEIHRNMVQAEHRLMRQPFYVVLGGGKRGSGDIKLKRIPDSRLPLTKAPPKQEGGREIYFKLSLFGDIDSEVAMSLVQWMTKDSPDFIQDIQLVERVLSEAKETNDMAFKLIGKSNNGLLLSQEGQLEASRLFETLKDALNGRSIPSQFSETDAAAIIESIRKASTNLVSFIEDSLTQLTPNSLNQIRNDVGQNVADLKERIGMRLAIIADGNIVDDHDSGIRVISTSSTSSQQSLRLGITGEQTVLVEYFGYDDDDPTAYAWTARQIRRIAALQSEPKDSAFRCMQGLGFTQESLRQAKLGIVYKVPDKYVNRTFITLSELIRKLNIVPLGTRYHLAACLCNAVLHLHSIGWYHKNITSHNVVIFGEKEVQGQAQSFKNWALESPYIVGFDCSRPSEAETRNTIDFSTKQNIYRHPERWGRSKPFERYHDLYSLGIMLLEIGCWRTLPDMDKKQKGWEDIANPESLRQFLLRATTQKLAHAAGSKYADAVTVCLEDRNWLEYEDWQIHRLVRQEVFGPLQAAST